MRLFAFACGVPLLLAVAARAGQPGTDMVYDVGPATEAGVPESASGGALMDEGLALTAGGSAIWVAHRRVR